MFTIYCVCNELQDVPIEGYTKYNDGWYEGKRLFKSKINRGVFLPLKGLHPDKRFANAEAEELPNCKLCALSQPGIISNCLNRT